MLYSIFPSIPNMRPNSPSILSDKGYDLLAKILVVGDVGVGKTNTILRYCDGLFQSHTLSTLGIDFKFKDTQCDGSRVRLQIWDTAGQEKYRTITRAYYSGAMGIILVYSVTDRNSYLSISEWMKDLRENSEGVVVLVSNKNDCAKEERKVTTNQGQKLANMFGVKYFQCSAKTGENVDTVFQYLVREVKGKAAINQSLITTTSRLVSDGQIKRGWCAC